MNEQEIKTDKPTRMLRITFNILIIAWLLLLGAWLAGIIKIGFR